MCLPHMLLEIRKTIYQLSCPLSLPLLNTPNFQQCGISDQQSLRSACTYAQYDQSLCLSIKYYEGGSICNENPFITPSTNALGSYAICQTKDQSVAVIMVYEILFYLSKFNKLHTF